MQSATILGSFANKKNIDMMWEGLVLPRIFQFKYDDFSPVDMRDNIEKYLKLHMIEWTFASLADIFARNEKLESIRAWMPTTPRYKPDGACCYFSFQVSTIFWNEREVGARGYGNSPRRF
jgi:hypothetical protein